MGSQGGQPERPVAIGVDLGTESGRVLLLDLSSGQELAVETVGYPHGVLDELLPDSSGPLPADWALQDPRDYLHVLRRGIPEALRQGSVEAARVVGIGIDVTSCTVLPALHDGTALCELPGWAKNPHAWPKLWKHHAAQGIADRMTEVAQARGEAFLDRYGGRISSEWYFPKLLQILKEDRAVYDAMDVFVEATDWIVWQLTGKLARSACPAGYKALWSPAAGLPPMAYFRAVAPALDDPAAKLGSCFLPLGARAGGLLPERAAELGLRPEVAVAVGNVDSFVSVPGAGIVDDGVLVSVVGTSICDMVVHPREVWPPGITGVVADGILPGRFGYEAGQPAVGDMFAWFADRLLGLGEGGSRRYGELEANATAVAPGASGLVALDWWNGNRSVLGNAALGGVLAGLSLQTTPGEIYRALLESVAFGARTIIDTFERQGVVLVRMVACGGIAERSPLLMQLMADVTGRTLETVASVQVPARGAALFGAVAAGAHAGGFDSIEKAAQSLAPSTARVYRPDPASREVYETLYGVYLGLHDELGRSRVEWLHTLKSLRQRALARRG